MPTWDDFLAWAGRIRQASDVNLDERGYKVEMARRIADACEQSQQGDASWPLSLRSALESGNLMAWQFADSVSKAIHAKPATFRKAIGAFWVSEPSVDAMDALLAALERAGLKGTPGNLTSLGSVLLMARDPSTFPPYRARFVARWAKAVGAEAPASSPRERYQTLLHLCDELVKRAPSAGLEVNDRLDAQGLAWATLQNDPPARWSPLDRARLSALQQGDDPEQAVVDRGTGRAPEMEAAAWLILNPGLHGKASPFDRDVTTWTADNASELLRRIDAAPLPGASSFWERFRAQLSGAPDPLVLLAAELMSLRLLPIDTVKAQTKVSQVRRILSWSGSEVPLPVDLETGLRAEGAFGGGMGYNQQAPQHLGWFCRFVRHWAEASEARRADALGDPFSFIELTLAVPDDVPTARYTLEYLMWPEIFPSVVSAGHRKKVHQHLMADLGPPSGKDELSRTCDLVALWAHHGCGVPDGPSWYREPYVHRWRAGVEAGPRAWLVRPSEGGSALVQRWVAEGFVSLKAHMLGDIPEGSSESEVRSAVKSGYMHLDATQQEATTRAYHRFLSVMKPDDLVATLNHGTLQVGVIIGDAQYVEETDSRLRREVAWSPQSVEGSDLPAPLASRLEQQGTVVELTSAYDELASLIDIEGLHGEDDTGASSPTVSLGADGEHTDQAGESAYRSGPPQLSAVSQDLADRLYMPQDDLQQMVDLLQARQQMVFYGPPGTGKTYVAKELAHHLVGDPSHYRLVQFHPSYSYEDFFEGYRPALVDGQPTFELRPGPLKQMVSACEEQGNRNEPYVLIIDEMNRANLAKVFGELYFLLEYRDETVQLQYQEPGSTPFSLPRNLFIIGTMNTADRSIALVDAAIRRRFPFYELHPGQEPVKGVLRKYLAAHHLPDERARLLAALNEAMGVEGRDLHIGPSYFMRAAADGEKGLERIWKYDILPLLEEHFYGQIDRDVIHERFGLATIRQRAAQSDATSMSGSVGGSFPAAGSADDGTQVPEA